MTSDKHPIIENFEKLEEEMGVNIPDEYKNDILEGVIFEEVRTDEPVPDNILRMSGLRRLNAVYKRLNQSAEEGNRFVEYIHEVKPDLTDEQSDRVDRIAARIYLYEDTALFLFLAQDLIETFSIQLLEKELILDRYQGSNATRDLLDRKIHAKGREELLHRTGIIDGKIKGKMRDVRKKRNVIAHRTEERQLFEFGPNALEFADKSLFVINELKHKLDGERYWSKK
jgi:hypothetical protein